MTEYAYDVHGIFSLNSNIPYFQKVLHAFRTGEERRNSINLEFRMVPNLQISTKGKQKVNVMFYYNDSDSSVEIDYPWIRPICAKLIFSDELKKCTFLFNGNFLRVSKLVGGFWRPISIMRAVLQMNLIRNNMVLIHAGVVRIGEQGFLIPGVENTGKTMTVWSLAERGAQFVSDEYSIFDRDGQCYGIASDCNITRPTARALGINFSRKDRILFTPADLRGKLLTVHLSSGASAISPERFFRICGKTQVGALTIIQNGVNFVKRIGIEEALRRVRSIQNFEFGWGNHPFLLAYSFFNPLIDLNNLLCLEDDLLRSILSNIRCFYIVSSSNREHSKAIEGIARTEYATSDSGLKSSN